MKNFTLEKNLLFIGDKSRFIFAKTISRILPSDYENFPLILEHGKTVTQIQSREKFFTVTSFRVPPGIKIFLLKADDDSWKDNLKKFSRIFLFEEFPLQKDSTQQLIYTLNALPKNRPPLTIVIMDLAHRQGSTDLDRLDDAIIEAKRTYESQGLDVVFFHSYDDVVNILHRHESLIRKQKNILYDDLEKIHDRMYELDFLYDDFIMDCNDANGCLSLSALNKICSFDSVNSSNRNSFWEAYNDAALKKLFPSSSFAKGNFNDLIKIYYYILTGDFDKKTSATGDQWIEHIKFELIEVLTESFRSRMSGGKFSGNISMYEARNIVAYKRLTGDERGRFYGINAEYGRRLRNFVEKDAKEILKLALNNYIHFFERVIR